MRIGFVGLGVMGFPMAGHLAKSGQELQVYNRSPDKAVRFVEKHGGTACRSAAEAAHGCDLLIMCVGADPDVRAVVAEALDYLAPGAIVVDLGFGQGVGVGGIVLADAAGQGSNGGNARCAADAGSAQEVSAAARCGCFHLSLSLRRGQVREIQGRKMAPY